MIFIFLPLMIDNPTHDKTFSSYTFLYSINVDAIFENPGILPRNSKGLQYVGKYHEHIATGDLHIISENKSCEIFCEDPKFSKSKCTGFEKASTTSIFQVWMIVLMFGALKKGMSKISLVE